MIKDTVVLGDFNLDFRKKNDVNYSKAHLFNVWDTRFDDLGLLQLVEFCSWSRKVSPKFRYKFLKGFNPVSK